MPSSQIGAYPHLFNLTKLGSIVHSIAHNSLTGGYWQICDASYAWCHPNQVGGRALQYHRPWQFERKNTLIWGAVNHGLYRQQKPWVPPAMAFTGACGPWIMGPIDGAYLWCHGQCRLWPDLLKLSGGCNEMQWQQEVEAGASALAK